MALVLLEMVRHRYLRPVSSSVSSVLGHRAPMPSPPNPSCMADTFLERSTLDALKPRLPTCPLETRSLTLLHRSHFLFALRPWSGHPLALCSRSFPQAPRMLASTFCQLVQWLRESMNEPIGVHLKVLT